MKNGKLWTIILLVLIGLFILSNTNLLSFTQIANPDKEVSKEFLGTKYDALIKTTSGDGTRTGSSEGDMTLTDSYLNMQMIADTGVNAGAEGEMIVNTDLDISQLDQITIDLRGQIFQQKFSYHSVSLNYATFEVFAMNNGMEYKIASISGTDLLAGGSSSLPYSETITFSGLVIDIDDNLLLTKFNNGQEQATVIDTDNPITLTYRLAVKSNFGRANNERVIIQLHDVQYKKPIVTTPVEDVVDEVEDTIEDIKDTVDQQPNFLDMLVGLWYKLINWIGLTI
jgi:hypothetical protein